MSGRKEDASLTLETLATKFKTSFNLLDLKLDQTRLTVEHHGKRVSSLELTADDLSQQVTELKKNPKPKLWTWRVVADTKIFTFWVYLNPLKVGPPQSSF